MLEIQEDEDNKRIYFQLENLDERTRRGMRQGFFRLGKDLQRELRKELLAKNKTGRVYIRRDRIGRRRRHRASGPGQTPANRTGNYRKNVGYQIHGAEELEFGIRDGAPYAEFLEDGTRKMAPRPGLKNTIDANTRDARSYFETEIETELNES